MTVLSELATLVHVTSVNDEQRQALLNAASHLLIAEGPTGLTVRRIASEAGTSTMGVYSRFGGKDGIVEALFVEGFEMLRDAMAAVPLEGDPIERLLETGRAYRHFALTHPAHYLVMFEAAVPDFSPTPACHDVGMSALAALEAHTARAIATGALRSGDVEATAHLIWANAHGLVSLELHGRSRTAGLELERFEEGILTLLRGLDANR